MADTIFYNSDYVVVEYIDLIKSPYLLLLSQIRKNHKLKEILKIEYIESMDIMSLYQWYINRKNQNFLIDLNRYPEEISNEELDKILDDQISITDKFYTLSPQLVLTDTLKIIKKRKMVKDIIIYHPHHNKYAEDDLKTIFGNSLLFMDNFDEVLDKAKENSTYFISDIDKILTMRDKGYLQCSSITLPVDYRYNKKNMTDFKLDFDDLFKKNPFKLSFFNACTYYVNEEENNDGV